MLQRQTSVVKTYVYGYKLTLAKDFILLCIRLSAAASASTMLV